MQAIEYNDYDGISGFDVCDVAKPQPSADQVLVKIYAAGLNPVDVKLSEGQLRAVRELSFPFRPGNEFAGVVESVGAAVKGFGPGDAVHALSTASGAFAEYIVVDPATLTKMPPSINFVEAAALPVAVATATAALDAAGVGQGMRLAIHAAAGGVGSIAVQLAIARGAVVTALTSATNTAFVSTLGAQQVLDRNTRYEDRIEDLDAVLDAYGPDAQSRSWSLLRPGGILVSIVSQPSEEEASRRKVRVARVFGNPSAAVLRSAGALVEQGKLKAHVERTYTLHQVKEALGRLATGTVRGKLVLQIA